MRERSAAISIHVAHYGARTAFPYNNMTTSIMRVPLPVIWGRTEQQFIYALVNSTAMMLLEQW